MKKTEGAMPLDRVLAFPVLVGLAAALLGMLLGACAVKAGRADMGSIPALAVSALCVGALLASFLAARRAPVNRLFWGVGAGAAVLLCVVLLSLTWFSEPADLPQAAINTAAALLASFLGAFIGSRRRKKKKRRR